MKVALIIPVLGIGGAERVVSNLTLYLPKEVLKHLVLYDASQISYSYEGILHDLALPGSDHLLTKLTQFMMRIIKLRRLKQNYGITTSISFTENPNLINILSRQREKVIVSVRNYRSQEIKNEGVLGIFYKVLLKLLYNRADLVVAVSYGIKQDLIEKFRVHPEKIKVIYNSYDLVKIQELAAEPLEADYRPIFESPVIITAGRLCKQKGHWHLIRAFSIVTKAIHEAKLVILGEGTLEDYLKKLVVELNLEKKVYFLGFRKNPFKFVSKSTVFVMPSLFEGFPNSLAEAMACGLPVVSTDCKTGPREVFYHQDDLSYGKTKDIEYADSGILIPVCDGTLYTGRDPFTREEGIMAECMIKVLADEELRQNYAQKALERVTDFSMESFVRNYLSIMQ